MIGVSAQPAPEGYTKKVLEPGLKFLARKPNPRSKDWNSSQYWQDILEELYDSYGGICAYCAEWIPSSTGDPTVDHFIPKSLEPHLAYDWSNFRLACLRFNRWKRDYLDVLDPFLVEHDWFFIQFPSLQVLPNPDLTDDIIDQVQKTIFRLRLNSGLCIKSRLRWVLPFSQGKISFDYLKENAPFIAYEIERQMIIDKMSDIIKT